MPGGLAAPGAGISAVLFLAALAASFLFNGVWGEWFGLALLLLALALVSNLWRWQGATAPHPGGALAAVLGLYALWLALSLAWHPVPQVGLAYFWILGALPLGYLWGRMEPEPETMMGRLAPGLLALAAALAALALGQLLLLGKPPRSLFLDINSHAGFLNLIALPAAGLWLGGPGKPGDGGGQAAHRFLLVVLAMLLVSVFLTRSRGASLALAGGIVWLVLTAGATPGRRLGLAALAAGSFFAADALWSGGVAERIETLFTPASAGADRFIIWRRAWAMLLANPWTGAGIGTFWLHWPRWRDPQDASGGFFVHNDYLQIWIEAGLPGLLLLLAVMTVTLGCGIRAMARGTGRERAEAAGLLAGLGATALQGFFNFNLYQLPILMVAGVLLARLDWLARKGTVAGEREHLISTPSSVPGIRILTAALAAPAVVYFAGQAAHAHSYRQALHQIAEGKYAAADQTLLWSSRMAPLADNVLVTHADLLRRLLEAVPPREAEQRRFLFRHSREYLERARELNPLRAETERVLGELLLDHPGLAGPGAGPEAVDHLRHALELDPRLFQARMALARHRPSDALHLLEAGLRHWYPPTPEVVPYYLQVAQAREQAGDIRGAEALRLRVRDMVAAGSPESAQEPGTGGTP